MKIIIWKQEILANFLRLFRSESNHQWPEIVNKTIAYYLKKLYKVPNKDKFWIKWVFQLTRYYLKEILICFHIILFHEKILSSGGGSLKVVSSTFWLVWLVCLTESTYETRKNNFYFTSKALFILEIIKF